MNRWTLGPRFSAYLSLNFKLMSGSYTYSLIYGLLYGAMYAGIINRDMMPFLWMLLALSLGPLLGYVPRLLKESISDDSAMFYVSIPVTSFETVMAKILAAAAGVWMPLIILGNLFMVGFYFSEEKWRIFVTRMWNLGFTRENLLPALLLIIWVIVILGIAIGGAALLSWFLGKRFCKKKERLIWVVYILLTAGMMSVMAGILWLIWLASFLPVLVRLLLIMTAVMGLSMLLVRLNVAALEKWYCI
ncbi:MAG: hypothetical protein IKU09_12000 [Firmicutes bacterium]|nr:hypothetical protein [Bacillota bacterium]